MTQSRGREVLKDVMRQARGGWMLVSLLSIGINLLLLVPSIYMMQVYDRVLRSSRLETLLYLTAAGVFCLLVYAALEALRLRTLSRIGEWIEVRLLGPVITGSLAATLARKAQPGRTPIGDLKTVRAFLAGPSVPSMCDVPWTPIFIAICFLIHFDIGMMALVFSVIILALALFNELTTSRMFKDAAMRQAMVQQSVVEAARNSETVSAMGFEPRIAARVEAANDAALDTALRVGDRTADISGIAKFVRVVAQLLIIALGAWLTLRNELTGGGMIAASIIMSRALQPLDQAIAAWRSFQSAREAWGRLRECLDESHRLEGGVELPAPAGKVTAETLVYSVPGADRPIVQGVAFELPAGETLMIVGPSGSGKSTLVKMLVGALQPFRGVARLDDAAIGDYPSRQRARHVGYMPQDLQIFSGQIKDSIARMGDAEDAEIVAAAQRAFCHEVIVGVPGAYNAKLLEGGAPLSGGERARLALARAVFGDPRLVVLDEPNANLDTNGEKALFDCVRGLKNRGTTVIIVSHRMQLAQLADKMLVLQEGRVRHFGPTGEVMKRLNEQVAPAAAPDVAPTPVAPPAPARPAARIRLPRPRGEAPHSTPQHETEDASVVDLQVAGRIPTGAA